MMFDEELEEDFHSYKCEDCGAKGAHLYRGWMFCCKPCTDKREMD